MTKDIVKITCYGETETMERDKAEKFYLKAMMFSEGSERERYTKIYLELKEGKRDISDTEN